MCLSVVCVREEARQSDRYMREREIQTAGAEKAGDMCKCKVLISQLNLY